MNEKSKIIAFYLPQFHPIPENDEWWEKGFTEWTNVVKSIPHRKGQHQPRVPLNNNYYDLRNIETLKWQADLAKKYNVYGFCFYHYWFNGKLLLEKPSELLINNPTIDLNYCFSWANEPWARNWDGKYRKILMPQAYGNKNDWTKHFNYLLPFFKDKRYIKENNKPMFLIYKSKAIEKCKQIMDLWEELAIKNGFNGIHFVETLRNGLDNRNLPFSAFVEFEPARTEYYTLSFFQLNFNRIRSRLIKLNNYILDKNLPLSKTVDFNKFYHKALNVKSKINTYGGVFMGWDNSPRRQNAGKYYTESSKEEFKDYLSQKMNITLNEYKTNYIFVNSWNEWCEGTYLEPDMKNKYMYLEAIYEETKS